MNLISSCVLTQLFLLSCCLCKILGLFPFSSSVAKGYACPSRECSPQSSVAGLPWFFVFALTTKTSRIVFGLPPAHHWFLWDRSCHALMSDWGTVARSTENGRPVRRKHPHIAPRLICVLFSESRLKRTRLFAVTAGLNQRIKL